MNEPLILFFIEIQFHAVKMYGLIVRNVRFLKGEQKRGAHFKIRTKM